MFDRDPMAPFQQDLTRLQTARDATDMYGQYKGPSDSREGRQNRLDYEQAKENEKEMLNDVVETIEAAPPEQLTLPQKFIAARVLEHVWRPDKKETKKQIREGFTVMDRVTTAIEASRGTVMVLDRNKVSLYESKGAEGISTILRGSSLEVAIRHRIEDGLTTEVESVTDPSFPNATVKNTVFAAHLLGRTMDGYPAGQLAKYDPAHPNYVDPLICLGTVERPRSDINEYLSSDERRYAARLLIHATDRQSWLHVQAPGARTKAAVTHNFAEIYLDVLAGIQLRDRIPRVSASHSGFSGDTTISTKYLRNTSLADLTASQRAHILYAADVMPSDVEAATREKIAKLADQDSAAAIMKSIKAAEYADRFFDTLG